MLRRLRERTGDAGLILAVTALVVALSGGAYAASGGLNSKQKKEVKSIAKSFQGTGPAGANGTNGTNGAKGDAGAKGDTGNAGSPGAPGKSVTTTTIATGGAKCKGFGGVEVKVEGAGSGTEVCNGEEGLEGEKGEKGAPWTPDNVLPTGATETGVWSLSTTATGTPELGVTTIPLQLVPMSFTIPLQAPPAAHFVTEEEQVKEEVPPGCTVAGVEGSFAEPLALSGHLCVYLGGDSNENFTVGWSVLGVQASSTGAFLQAEVTKDTIANGSWAVTG